MDRSRTRQGKQVPALQVHAHTAKPSCATCQLLRASLGGTGGPARLECSCFKSELRGTLVPFCVYATNTEDSLYIRQTPAELSCPYVESKADTCHHGCKCWFPAKPRSCRGWTQWLCWNHCWAAGRDKLIYFQDMLSGSMATQYSAVPFLFLL